jgi:chromosome segregation ATPase
MSPTHLIVLAAALALAPLAADAQGMSTFRCQGKDGKKYYGNTIPPQCYGRLVEQLNAQGMVVKRIDPDEKALSEKELEAKEKRKAEQEKIAAASREAQRRDRALLATYTSERDIEEQRTRALADNQKAVREAEERVANVKKRRESFNKEMEFYNDKSGKTKVPPKLQEEIRQADFDIQVQEQTLDKWKKEVANINAKYDEDKKRYLALTGKKR